MLPVRNRRMRFWRTISLCLWGRTLSPDNINRVRGCIPYFIITLEKYLENIFSALANVSLSGTGTSLGGNPCPIFPICEHPDDDMAVFPRERCCHIRKNAGPNRPGLFQRPSILVQVRT